MVIAALIAGFVLWYLLYGLELHMNGGSIGSNPYFMHFPFLFEELGWLLPISGKKRRVAWIKKHMEGFENGAFWNGSRMITFGEITKSDDYDKAAREILPGLGHFLFMHVFIPLSPLFLFVLIKMID